MTVIEVAGLHRSYGDQVAVEDVGLEVRAGEIFGLLGPNGAGKTTTVECLQGLRRRDRGQVRVLGLDPERDGDRLRRRIGAQLQSSALPDRLRVGEALWLFARDGDGGAPLDQLGRRWGLERLWRRPFAKLSGGEQQRLFIALALVNRPELVFFDELTTGLDPQARRATWDLVRQVRDDGATVVLVTHFMEEATGTPSELIGRGDAGQRVSFTWPGADAAWLSQLEGVERVTRRADAVEVMGTGPLAVRVAAALAGRGVAPADCYVPAYAIGSIAATGLIAIPVHLAAYRERGVLRRLRASGIAAWPVLAAQTLVAALIVTVGSAVMVALGDASYELSTPASPVVVAAGFLLATATFCAIGVALASLLPTARAAQVVGLLLFFAMFFISGGGPPEAILPDGVKAVAGALPMAYSVDVLQRGWWTGDWDVTGLVVQAAVLVAATAVAP